MSDTNKNVDLGKKDELIKKESAFVDLLSMEINKKIVGQKTMIERLLIGLLGKGHIYLKVFQDLPKHWLLIVLVTPLKAHLAEFNLPQIFFLLMSLEL